MIYVFLGQDFNIVKKRIDELINKLEISNIIKYDYSESSIKEILDEVNYVDLFNEKKLIIVSDFSFKKMKVEDEELIIKYINNMNENVIIIKCNDDSLDERKSITKLLRSKCKIEECKKLDYKSLHEYVTNMLKESNINANYNQVKKILDICEYNPDYTISEVEKLIIYKLNESELYDKDIDDVISKNNEKEMFSFIDNVMSKNKGKMLDSFKILTSGNVDSIVILDNLSRQFRLLLQVKLLKSEMDELSISRNLGVNPYVIKKLYPYINNYTENDLADILYKLSEADIDIKVNGYDKDKVIESFLVTL